MWHAPFVLSRSQMGCKRCGDAEEDGFRASGVLRGFLTLTQTKANPTSIPDHQQKHGVSLIVGWQVHVAFVCLRNTAECLSLLGDDFKTKCCKLGKDFSCLLFHLSIKVLFVRCHSDFSVPHGYFLCTPLRCLFIRDRIQGMLIFIQRCEW